ncbi:MAG: PD-(D/E)XK nuclease family protein [Marinilabiliaceae bacterium]|nr:PD-(D/E)XK nuclease family protein [Marinilabiliaceae bacterium]
MLAGLLNPDENHGHGSLLIESFLRKIGVYVVYSKEINLKIETERNANGRRIDILVSWLDGNKKHAVIIENKLNNAPNQPNQLNDYYNAIVSEGYEVDKVVYMPLSKKWQKSEDTDTCKEILNKTIDFDAQDIVDWLESLIINLV